MYMGPIEASAQPAKATERSGIGKCIAGLCLLAAFIPYVILRIVIDGLLLLGAGIFSGLSSLGETALREVSRGRSSIRRT